MSKEKMETSWRARLSFLASSARSEGVTVGFLHEKILPKIEQLTGSVEKASSLRPDSAENKQALNALRTLFSEIQTTVNLAPKKESTEPDQSETTHSFRV